MGKNLGVPQIRSPHQSFRQEHGWPNMLGDAHDVFSNVGPSFGATTKISSLKKSPNPIEVALEG